MMIRVVSGRDHERRMGRESAVAFATVFEINRLAAILGMTAVNGAGVAMNRKGRRGSARA